jgi:hypothetical protein
VTRSAKHPKNVQEHWTSERSRKCLTTFDHWLKLARETRALANRVSFDSAKKRLLELAKDYDRIAVRIHERKEKTQE